MIQFSIPISHLKKSTNSIYAGEHWTKRQEYKDSVFGTVAVFCRKLGKIERYPVQIKYSFVFASKPLDTLNCAYLAKCIEDALRTLKILEDDDYTHVARAIIEVAKAGRGPDEPGSPAPLEKRGKKALKKKPEDTVKITIEDYN